MVRVAHLLRPRKSEPLAQPSLGQHTPYSRREPASAPAGAHAPEAPGSETEHQQLPLADQDAIHFAHDGIGVRRELQCVWEQYSVHGVAGDWNLRRSGDYVGPIGKTGPRDDRLAPGAAATQQLARAAPGADLQEFPAENVLERLPEQLRFGCKQRPPQGALPPGPQSGVAIENT